MKLRLRPILHQQGLLLLVERCSQTASITLHETRLSLSNVPRCCGAAKRGQEFSDQQPEAQACGPDRQHARCHNSSPGGPPGQEGDPAGQPRNRLLGRWQRPCSAPQLHQGMILMICHCMRFKPVNRPQNPGGCPPLCSVISFLHFKYVSLQECTWARR